MSEPKTTPEETCWTRYRHKGRHRERRYENSEKPEIEYEVRSDFLTSGPLTFSFKGEWCHLLRTVRNLYFTEQVHQPAFTTMPAVGFLDVYERVED